MSDFIKYQHIERYGTADYELTGLTSGTVYVFPKIDGSNHCVYYDKDLGRVAYASRNQLLSEGYDSTGFWHFADEHKVLGEFVTQHRNLRLYGEYLTPHTLRNYQDDAWFRYYVFDIWDDDQSRWLDWHEIHAVLDDVIGSDPFICIIPVLAKLRDPTTQDLLDAMESDTYLVQKGTKGEGIIIKNYEYRNPYGRQTWGKIVRQDFKTKKGTGHGEDKVLLPEELAVTDSITQEFVEKEFHKFTTDRGVHWESRMTGDFLKYIYEEWWRDCSFEAFRDLKAIDLKAVRKMLSKTVMSKFNRIGLYGGD